MVAAGSTGFDDGMSGRRQQEDEAIRTEVAGDPAPGLEGVPRADIVPLETALPSLTDRMVRGPVVLHRDGRDVYVVLPLDEYRRLWYSAPRPPVIEVEGKAGD
jgi:hypothetical protein